MIQGKDKGFWNKEISFLFQQLDQNDESKYIFKGKGGYRSLNKLNA